MVQSVCTAIMKEKGECPNVPQPLKLTPIGLYSRHGQTPEEEGGISFTDCTVIDHRPARPNRASSERFICLFSVP